jgi:hypothetical protein
MLICVYPPLNSIFTSIAYIHLQVFLGVNSGGMAGQCSGVVWQWNWLREASISKFGPICPVDESMESGYKDGLYGTNWCAEPANQCSKWRSSVYRFIKTGGYTGWEGVGLINAIGGRGPLFIKDNQLYMQSTYDVDFGCDKGVTLTKYVGSSSHKVRRCVLSFTDLLMSRLQVRGHIWHSNWRVI